MEREGKENRAASRHMTTRTKSQSCVTWNSTEDFVEKASGVTMKTHPSVSYLQILRKFVVCA